MPTSKVGCFLRALICRGKCINSFLYAFTSNPWKIHLSPDLNFMKWDKKLSSLVLPLQGVSMASCPTIILVQTWWQDRCKILVSTEKLFKNSIEVMIELLSRCVFSWKLTLTFNLHLSIDRNEKAGQIHFRSTNLPSFAPVNGHKRHVLSLHSPNEIL